MSRGLVVLALGVLTALPQAGLAAELNLRLGGFLPRAKSNLFRDDSELYRVDREDWRGLTGGAEFALRLAPHLRLGFHLDGYGRTLHTSYRDFVRESGREITQSLRVNIVPLGVTLRYVPRDRRRQLTPFVGAGVDVFFYKYEELGDFVDFQSEELTILDDHFVSEGAALGFHASAGLRVPLTDDLGLVGEARYQWAEDEMGDDFRGNDLDLSGLGVTLGLNLRF